MSSKPSDLHHTDRRAGPRLETRLRAVIEDTEHGTLVFTARGFSRTGAFLERRERDSALPMVGCVVRLTFHWPLETQMAPVTVDAIVIHHTPEGMGVKFEIG